MPRRSILSATERENLLTLPDAKDELVSKAGICIALKAAKLWQELIINWQPWKMSADDLASLRVRKPLNEADRLQLAALQEVHVLPARLAELAAWMMENGEKGEQEGFI
ncbi:MAG: hypothetical protein Q7U78_04640 [Gallionella sp.]|nr:hypothetical protein [Gallionella sp.]